MTPAPARAAATSARVRAAAARADSRAVVVASTAAMATATVLGLGSPWQPLTVFWFVAVVPGLAWQRFLGLRAPLERAVVVVAASLAAAAVLSELLALRQIWSSGAVLGLLTVVSLLGCLPVRRRP